jgi:hypothetical protein
MPSAIVVTTVENLLPVATDAHKCGRGTVLLDPIDSLVDLLVEKSEAKLLHNLLKADFQLRSLVDLDPLRADSLRSSVPSSWV